MSFTYQQIRVMAHAFLTMLPALRISTHLGTYELDEESIVSLAKDADQFLNHTDPMRPLESELRYRIANIIENEYGESNIPHDEALETADRILTNIQMNFQLVEAENYAELLMIVKRAKTEIARLQEMWKDAIKEGQELEKGDHLDG